MHVRTIPALELYLPDAYERPSVALVFGLTEGAKKTEPGEKT